MILSNDERGELNTMLLHAPDGRLRLRHLLPALAPLYDLVLIDTQGARSVLWRWPSWLPTKRYRRSRRKSWPHASCNAAPCN